MKKVPYLALCKEQVAQLTSGLIYEKLIAGKVKGCSSHLKSVMFNDLKQKTIEQLKPYGIIIPEASNDNQIKDLRSRITKRIQGRKRQKQGDSKTIFTIPLINRELRYNNQRNLPRPQLELSQPN